VDQNSEAGKTLIIPLRINTRLAIAPAFFNLSGVTTKNAKTAKERKGISRQDAKVLPRRKEKGKEDGRLYRSHFLRVSFAVPTTPELQTFEERTCPAAGGKEGLNGL
jgi:hypothetical protein